MAKVQGSYGLILDLGQPQAEDIRQCYTFWWQHAHKPQPLMGEFMGVPKAATGEIHLSNALEGKCYTRFESTQLGVPPDWVPPVQLHISVSEMSLPLPENPELQTFFSQWVEQLYPQVSFRAAFMCDLTAFYFMAEALSEPWFDWQQDKLWQCWLPCSHPWATVHAGTQRPHHLMLYDKTDWLMCVTNGTETERYERLRQHLLTVVFNRY